MPKRPTRSNSSSTRRKEAVVREEMTRASRPRRRKTTTRTATPELEPAAEHRPRRSVRRKKATPEVDTRIIHLAISPRAGVILLAYLNRMRYENEPALDAIKEGLKRDLEEMGK